MVLGFLFKKKDKEVSTVKVVETPEQNRYSLHAITNIFDSKRLYKSGETLNNEKLQESHTYQDLVDAKDLQSYEEGSILVILEDTYTALIIEPTDVHDTIQVKVLDSHHVEVKRGNVIIDETLDIDVYHVQFNNKESLIKFNIPQILSAIDGDNVTLFMGLTQKPFCSILDAEDLMLRVQEEIGYAFEWSLHNTTLYIHNVHNTLSPAIREVFNKESRRLPGSTDCYQSEPKDVRN